MTETAYERITEALRGHGCKVVERGGTRASSTCPHHEDRNPSLSVTGIEGQALMHCHAGCDAEDVLAALGFTLADLYDEKSATYRYDDGRTVERYYQGGKKRFRQKHTEGTPTLYRLARLVDAGPGAVFLVEGEKDVHAIEAAGGVATTAPQGATNFDKVDVSPLAGRHVTVVVDRDGPGRKWAEVVARRLAGYAAALRFVEAATGKDAADHIAAGHGLDDFVPMQEAPATTDGAAEQPARAVRLVSASRIKPKRVRWLWAGRVPVGEITLVAGREGAGKSTFLAWLVRAITRGELPGEFFGQPRAVLYAAAEDSWAYTVVPRLIAAGADLDLVYRVEVVDQEHGHATLTLPKDTAEVMAAGAEVDAAVLMLDPGLSFLDDRIDTYRTPEVRPALEALRRHAERYGLSVVMLCHFNKGQGTDVLTKIAGSRAFAEVARAALAVAVDEPDEDDDEQDQADERTVILSQAKNNLGRSDHPNLTYVIRDTIVETEDGDAHVGRLHWTGESKRTAEQALNGVRRKKPRGSTAQMLIDFIAGKFRPVESKEVEAAHPDINPGTVRSTLARLAKRGDLVQPHRGYYSLPGTRTPATTATTATTPAQSVCVSERADATSATEVAEVAVAAPATGPGADATTPDDLWSVPLIEPAEDAA